MTTRNDSPGGNYVQKVREDTNRAMSEVKGQKALFVTGYLKK